MPEIVTVTTVKRSIVGQSTRQIVDEDYWSMRLHTEKMPTLVVAMIIQAIADFAEPPPSKPERMKGERASRYRWASTYWLDAVWFLFSNSDEYPNLKYFCECADLDVDKIRILILADRFGAAVDRGAASPYPRFAGQKSAQRRRIHGRSVQGREAGQATGVGPVECGVQGEDDREDQGQHG